MSATELTESDLVSLRDHQDTRIALLARTALCAIEMREREAAIRALAAEPCLHHDREPAAAMLDAAGGSS